MRTSTVVAALAALVLLVFGCGRASESSEFKRSDAPAIADMNYAVSAAGEGNAEQEEEKNGATPPEKALSSSAARAIGDSSRRFIRTADLRFRAKDVVKTAYAIEDLVARFDGFVANTHLATNVDQRYTTPISEDSLLETTKFTVSNRITIRVPFVELDTTLKSLVRFVDFLDHRTVSAQDVRLMILSNRMTQDRVARHEKRLTAAIDEQGRKLKETMPAEDRLLDRQEQADQAAMSNLELEDRIAFSTITLDIHQRQETRHELLPNEQNIERYEPGFFSQLGAALSDGWDLLVQFFLLIARIWSVLLLVGAIVMVVRRLTRRKA
ncbi:MAG: DUF4349 domain-containing protein [Flavobacteriales bacterium]